MFTLTYLYMKQKDPARAERIFELFIPIKLRNVLFLKDSGFYAAVGIRDGFHIGQVILAECADSFIVLFKLFIDEIDTLCVENLNAVKLF